MPLTAATIARRVFPFALTVTSFFATTNITNTAIAAATHSLLLSASPHDHRRQHIAVPFQRYYAMGSDAPATANFPKGKTEEEWRAQLSPEQFRILRKKGTEMGGTGQYDSHYPKEGVYTCAGCDSPLYNANTKFKSGCGWPAFFDAIPGAIDRHVDRTFGMKRIEITCRSCGGHLGHVFEGEGFPTPTDEVSSGDAFCARNHFQRVSPSKPLHIPSSLGSSETLRQLRQLKIVSVGHRGWPLPLSRVIL